MGTDFSRVRLNALLDYAGVELKQGAVLLDGDANELMDILDRRVRALASDVLGRARVSSTTPDAFEIKPIPAGGLSIGIGRLYVDGLLAECHGGDPATAGDRTFDSLLAEPKFDEPLTYAKQPYVPLPSPALPTTGRHLVYLDVWNREVTHLEQPDLVEVAIGVEATSRIQTVWQVKVLEQPVGGDATCASPDADLPGWAGIIASSTGVLTTGTFEVAPVDDPCELPPTGGYRGLENQLYRVEIHDSSASPGGATFKWSRDNASVGSRVASIVSGAELELDSLGRDDVLSFKAGDWVEITNDVREFAGRPGDIRKITVDAARRRIAFAPALSSDLLPSPQTFPNSSFARDHDLRVRRWDHGGVVHRTDPGGTPVAVQNLDGAPPPGILPGLIKVPAATTTLILEHGVTVRLEPGPNGFRSGDHWVFAARTADASVEPLVAAPPRGIHHHYARLAIWDVDKGTVTDCRDKWPPEGGHDCSCTACVTAESHLGGQFTIQMAVDKVKPTGGTVCLGPGQYEVSEPVRIDGAASLRVRGQGFASLIVATAGAFEITDSFATSIENLGIFSTGDERPAISADNVLGLSLNKLVLGAVGRTGEAIALRGIVAGATIDENVVFARRGIVAHTTRSFDPTTVHGGDFSVLVLAAVKIDDNIFLCSAGAVAFEGDVFYLLDTRIAGNEILACRDAGISALGFGLTNSSLTIRGNDLLIPGSGIRCSGEGIWIEANKIASSAGDRSGATAGIALAKGANPNGIAQCQLLANQIAGFAAGISFDAPAAIAIVKQNIVENCAGGIVSTEAADFGMVSIENNQLRAIEGPAQGTPAPGGNSLPRVIGIGMGRARSATIAGNTIRSLGAGTARAQLCAAIYTAGALRARIIGNEAIDIGPKGEFPGVVAGILLTAPLLDFEVNHNRVEREAEPSSDAVDGDWKALFIGRAAPVPGAGQGTGTLTGTFGTVADNLAGAAPAGRAAAPSSAAIGALPAEMANRLAGDFRFIFVVPADGSILGNVFKTRGARPVEVSANQCLFNDNRIDGASADGVAAVTLSTWVAVVNANRVSCGDPSILIGTSNATVLGNITSGGIRLPIGVPPPPGPPFNIP